MNKTAFKDIVREIKSNIGRFFSIFSLLFISMIAFTGVLTATTLLEKSPEKLYTETNLNDINITSTLGLDERDEIILETNKYVEDFEMSKFVDVISKKDLEIIRIQSLPQKINLPILLEGNLPKKGDEIAVGYDYFKDKIKIGDKISFLNSENKEDIKELKINEFVVVGFVRNPLELSEESTERSNIGSGTISSFGFITEENLDMDYFTRANIIVKKDSFSNSNSFSKEYTEQIEKIIKEMENSFKNRPTERLEKVKDDANIEIIDGEKEIAEARQKIEDARKELEEGKQELDDGERKLKEAELDIKEGELDLLEARRELNQGKIDYEQGKIDLEKAEKDARVEIADGKKKLADAKVELEKGKRELADGKIKYEDGLKEFQRGENLYKENLAKYEDGKRQLDEFKEKIRIGKEIQLGEINAAKSKDELESKIASLNKEVNTHSTNISNYTAQIEYNKTLLENPEEKEKAQGKISELQILLNSENENLNKKTAELNQSKEALNSFETVQKEGIENKYVLNYSDEVLEKSEKELKEGKAQLDEAKIELDKGRKELQDAKKEIDDAEKKIIDGENEYNKGIADIKAAEKELEDSIRDGRKKLEDARIKLEDGEIKYQDGIVALKEGKIEYEDALKEFEDGKKEYEEGLETFEKETKDALVDIQEGEEDLRVAKENILKLKTPKFMIESRRSDSLFYTVYGFPGSLKILAAVFSALALMVSLLVAYTTMTRMVDERRILVGTYKGLGYDNSIIAGKFLVFGGVSGILGAILGSLAGQLLLSPLIYRIYMDGMILEEPVKIFSIPLTIIGIVLALITTTFSAYLSVNKTLKENTASLLRPKAPKSGSRIFLEKIKPIWSNLGFMNKITARNIFRYKSRMLMTIIGVAVCMALMVLGFGMKYSMENVGGVQFNEIQNFQLIVAFKDDIEKDEISEIQSQLRNLSNITGEIPVNMEILKLQIPGENTQNVNLVVDIEDKLEEGYNFRNRKNKEVINLTDDGVLVTEKLANLMKLSVGSDLEMEISDTNVVAKVSGIVENYLGHSIFMKSGYYEEISKTKVESNGSLVFLGDENLSAETSSEILKIKNVAGVVSDKTSRNFLEDTLESLNIIILVIVVISMLLALVVLYNLTNINVSERIRELSTMKVLGFYPKELTEYVYKETLILSIMGIILGMILGKAIVEFILAEFAPLNIMFGDPKYLNSYMISAVFTLLFTVIVMFIMHRKLKKINMVEALKSVD